MPAVTSAARPCIVAKRRSPMCSGSPGSSAALVWPSSITMLLLPYSRKETHDGGRVQDRRPLDLRRLPDDVHQDSGRPHARGHAAGPALSGAHQGIPHRAPGRRRREDRADEASRREEGCGGPRADHRPGSLLRQGDGQGVCRQGASCRARIRSATGGDAGAYDGRPRTRRRLAAAQAVLTAVGGDLRPDPPLRMIPSLSKEREIMGAFERIKRVMHTWTSNTVNSAVYVLSGGTKTLHEGRYHRSTSRWTNWNDTFSAQPRRFETPESEAASCEIVRSSKNVR